MILQIYQLNIDFSKIFILVAKIGRALLDPSYTNPERQREALYQGTVDYLKAHPEIHLGDRLSDARKAALTAPMLWYESRVIDGRSTLVPVLLLPEGDLGRYSQAAGGGIVGGDVFIKADQVTNAGTILATGTLTINAGTILNEQLTSTTVSAGKHGTYTQTQLLDGGTLSGGTVAITTLGDFTSVGGRIHADGALTLTAGGTVAFLAQQTGASFDETSHHVRSQGQTVTSVGTEVTAGAGMTITGGHNIVLQATHLAAPTVDLRTDGTIAFLAGHDFAASQVSGTKTGLFTEQILDHGRSDESLVYPTIDGRLTTHAAGIAVEYEAGQDVTTGTGKKARFDHLTNAADGDASPRAVVTGLSAQAGLGWMAQVAQGDTPVTYAGLTTQHRQWNNDRTVLSPAAQALIVVVVALATQGMGAGVLAAIGETAATAATAAATAAAIDAAAASLISGTIVGGLNGDLDPARLFLNAVLAAASAGVLNLAHTQLLPQMGDALGLQAMTTNGQVSFGLGNPAIPATQTFGDVVQNGLAKLAVDAPVRAVVQALGTGTPFGKALLASLKTGATADVLQPALFYGVGDLGQNGDAAALFGDGTPGKALLHAAVGAGGGYVLGGERGALGGALGAGLSEAVSPLAEGLNPQDQQNLAQLLGAFGSLAAGDPSMAGSTAALNGLLYNLLLHNTPEDIKKAKDLLASCDAADTACRARYQNVLAELPALAPGGVYYSADSSWEHIGQHLSGLAQGLVNSATVFLKIIAAAGCETPGACAPPITPPQVTDLCSTSACQQGVASGEGVGMMAPGLILPLRGGNLGNASTVESAKLPTAAEIAASKITWVDENASMSSAARDFNDSATGARSNVLTHSGQAPAITRTLDDGTTTTVRFDGLDDGVLVDRKLSVVTTDKAKDQALRQSQALQQNGLTARWEVPNAQQEARAQNMFNQLGITNITVKVVGNGK